MSVIEKRHPCGIPRFLVCSSPYPTVSVFLICKFSMAPMYGFRILAGIPAILAVHVHECSDNLVEAFVDVRGLRLFLFASIPNTRRAATSAPALELRRTYVAMSISESIYRGVLISWWLIFC